MSFGQNPFSVVAFGESSQQEDATFVITGVAGTGAVTAAEGKAGASVTPTGVFATGTIGTPTEQGRVTHGVTGVAGTSALGTIAITGGAGTVISITGVVGTGAVNGITFGGDANVALTGVSATCITDDPSVNGDEITSSSDANIAITGVAGTTAITAAVGKAGSTNVPTGQEAIGSIGSVTIVAKCVLSLTGVAGTGSIGTVTPNCQAVVVPTGVQGTFTIGNETINAVQFDYESIKENYSRARTVYLSSHSSNSNTSYVRAA